ncbi:MAG: response regulator [Leptolyngbya sp. SIOISBB]|nr:response regulator [Leptolyngbya sp. SIOISBB]
MSDAIGGFILIVDDNPTNLSVLSKMLKNDGWMVRVATSGESALHLVSAELPSLILLDIMMPDPDGIETCRLLKDSPRTCEVPVIFMTALNEAPTKVEGLSSGAVDYVTKPFSEAEVLARVRLHSKQSRLLGKLYAERRALQDRLIDLMEMQVGADQAVLQPFVEALEIRSPVSSIDINVVDGVESYARKLLEMVRLCRETESLLTPSAESDLSDLDDVSTPRILEICQAALEPLSNWSTPERVDRQRVIASAWAMVRCGFPYQVIFDAPDGLRVHILGGGGLSAFEVEVPKQPDSANDVDYLLGTEADSIYLRDDLIARCEAALNKPELIDADTLMSVGRAWAMLKIGCRYEAQSDESMWSPVILQIEDPIDELSFAEIVPPDPSVWEQE